MGDFRHGAVALAARTPPARPAATRSGCRVSRQAVTACLWPQCPCESEFSVRPARRILWAWAAPWHALRDAARTACGRRRAATWRGCRVSRKAVTACLWPQRPCESECSVRPARRILWAWAAPWHALRDAARTACGRRRAATRQSHAAAKP